MGFINRKDNGFNWNFDKAFADLHWMNQLRGVHGSGVFTVDQKNAVNTFKVPACYEALVSQKKYSEKMFQFDNKTFVVGHDRWATSGKVDLEHTHPFTVDDITLVHNGSLTMFPKITGAVDMDSYAITHLIAKEGIQEAINKISGSFSLVWYDKADQSLHFLRNEDRPMFFIKTPEHDGMFFGSEPFMVLAALHRHNIKWGTVEATKPYTEFIFDLGLEEGRSREIIKKALPVTVHTGQTNGGTPKHTRMKKSKMKQIVTGSSPSDGIKNHLDFLHEKWVTETYDGKMEFVTTEKESTWGGKIIPQLPAIFRHEVREETVPDVFRTQRKHETNVISIVKDRLKQVPIDKRQKCATSFAAGQRICFSLDEFRTVRKKNVAQTEQNNITGILPAPYDKEYMVEGQTGMDSGFLAQNDSLYSCVINSFLWNDTQQKYVILVREIAPTSLKDPLKMTEWEMWPRDLELPATPISETYPVRINKYKPVDFDQCDDCGGYYKIDDLVIERTGYKTCLNCVEREVQKTEENDKRILAAIAEGETRVVLH